MELGTRVRFVNRWDKHKANSSFYPPVGTLGTITWISAADNIIEVQWDSGTLIPGKWWCNAEDVEIVEGEKINMKELTAQEAKVLADNNKIVEKMTRKILRQVYKKAKKGGYSLKYGSRYGEIVDKQICERLKGLGYKACTSIIAANIFVYWDKVGEE